MSAPDSDAAARPLSASDKRKAIIELLDREDAWENIATTYIAAVRADRWMVKFTPHGIMSRATIVGRIARDLNDILGNVVLITDPTRPELEQDDLLHPRRVKDINLERNAEMSRLRSEEQLTLAEIGRRFGMTKERVQQIVGKTGKLQGPLAARLEQEAAGGAGS